MRYPTKILLCLTYLGIFLSSAQAQTIPGACEQYYRALIACTNTAIRYYELTDMKNEKAAKELLNKVKKQRESVRELVATKGQDMAQEFCTSPNFVKPMNQLLDSILLPLVFNRIITEPDDECILKAGSIAQRH